MLPSCIHSQNNQKAHAINSNLPNFYQNPVPPIAIYFAGYRYDSLRELVQSRSYMDSSGFSGFKRALDFKYVLSTDGSTIDDTRVYWLLLSRALVFKQITGLLPVGVPSLIPFVHYIPVREDLADLRSKVLWARAHDATAQKIAERGFAFSWRHFRQRSWLDYLQQSLLAYTRRFPPDVEKEWVRGSVHPPKHDEVFQ